MDWTPQRLNLESERLSAKRDAAAAKLAMAESGLAHARSQDYPTVTQEEHVAQKTAELADVDRAIAALPSARAVQDAYVQARRAGIESAPRVGV